VQAATRAVAGDEIREFWERGVVCLRRILPPEAVLAMAGPVDETLRDARVTVAIADFAAAAGAELLTDPRAAASGAPRGRFLSGRDHWTVHPAFADFACRSALPGIAAALLRSQRIWLYEDSVLVKEPGTREETAIHQDLAYFQVDGEQICTMWIPLDAVDVESGAVRYVVGSHRSKRSYRPNLFVSHTPLPGTEGETVPQLEAFAEAEIACFETAPGDVVVHHARTLHGASGNASANRRRRAISLRYCGDDARYRLRPGASRKPHHERVRDGQPLAQDEPGCPLVWPRRS
jgi:ectoine hydroxylase-related dioxygenase (phytanoyl-CoA dioxygenase family)